MILREPHRTRWEIEEQLPALKTLLPGLILHATNVNAWRFAELYDTGLHLPSHVDPKSWRDRFAGLLGISCHGLEEVMAAEKAGLDYAVLSPIFSPLSKTDSRPPIGPQQAAGIQKATCLPIFGLGGMHPKKVATCRDLFGVASLGHLFGTRTNRTRQKARAKAFLDRLQKQPQSVGQTKTSCYSRRDQGET